MFKTIYNSVNISPTKIILVSKLTFIKGEYRKNNVWLWSETFTAFSQICAANELHTQSNTKCSKQFITLNSSVNVQN